MSQFENFEVCCPKQLGESENWRTKLEYEYSEDMNEVNQIILKMNLLSHDIRLGILFCLFKRGHCVCEIIEKLKIKNSLASYHISMMEDNGLITRVNQGGYVFLKITSIGRKYLSWVKSMPMDQS